MRPCCPECHGILEHWPGCPEAPEEPAQWDEGERDDRAYEAWRDER